MRHFVLTTALCVGLAAPLAAQSTSYDASTVLARVNGSDITLGHVIAMVEGLPEQYQQIPDDQLLTGVLDQLVSQAALAASADPNGTRAQLAIENTRMSVLANIVAGTFAKDVADADIQAAYDEQFAKFEGAPEFNASHILVATEEEAASLIETLNGGADFAELAQEKSTGPSGPNGGELGWFGAGMMVPPFEAAVQTMEAGDISAPVQTQFGWHVVKLNEKRVTAPPPLEEIRDEIAQSLGDQAIRAGVEAAQAAAEIERVDVAVPATAIRETFLID